MTTSTLTTAGTVLSFVDLALIGGVYFTLNNRLKNLEGDTSVVSSKAPSGTLSKINLEERVVSLENTNEILIHRLRCYDELFKKIMIRVKELDDSQTKHVEASSSPPRRTNIRIRRDNSTRLARKEPFVDYTEDSDEVRSSDPPLSPEESDEDDMFSYLN